MSINLPKMKNHYSVICMNVYIYRMGMGAEGNWLCDEKLKEEYT